MLAAFKFNWWKNSFSRTQLQRGTYSRGKWETVQRQIKWVWVTLGRGHPKMAEEVLSPAWLIVPLFCHSVPTDKKINKEADLATGLLLFSISFCCCKWQHLLLRNQRRLIASRHYLVITAPPPYDLSNQLSSISELCKSISSLSGLHTNKLAPVNRLAVAACFSQRAGAQSETTAVSHSNPVSDLKSLFCSWFKPLAFPI